MSSVKQLLASPNTVNFRRSLLNWYDRARRDLPWRKTHDPYRIWVSEIMLQQTRVAAVIEYYGRFLKRFPTVKKLASARKSSVLAAWSGLGYYRRARMMHAAAKKIVREYGEEFPVRSETLRTLPGIGRYTSAAIASIAFGEAVAVVDGNVERVLQRISGDALSGEKAWEEASRLLDPERPGDFNQAMMELGATICVPRQPACLLCPIANTCRTRGELPVRAKEKRQKRELTYLLDVKQDRVRVAQRAQNASLMAGMWELPEIRERNGHMPWLRLRHSITVTDYVVHVVRGTESDKVAGTWVAKSRLRSIPLTGLARKILRLAQVI